ncbi:MAG TPA: helix-hairpin-helix domain-containing protein [Blastocatellia bacterium]|nr:helix-hairpin-helix domain-containing protein [Blastocatellia bacterium]
MKNILLSRWLRSMFFTLACALFVGIWWAQPSAGKITVQDEPGKLELQKICKGCHELEKAFSIKQDRNGWTATMEKMVSFGMKSTEEEYKAVLEYLVKHYAAEDVPKVKVNKATAIELESGLSLKRSQARAVIEYREKNGAFKSIEDLKKVPGLEADKIEAKKDRISFEQ